MQATAEAARAETIERFAAEAKAASERVQADAAEEITELRRNADDDVASIRDWSKGEIARIREETETQDHRAQVRPRGRARDARRRRRAPHRARQRRGRRLRAEMADLLRAPPRRGRSRPTFATMAERIPEPPSLDAAADADRSTVTTPARPSRDERRASRRPPVAEAEPDRGVRGRAAEAAPRRPMPRRRRAPSRGRRPGRATPRPPRPRRHVEADDPRLRDAGRDARTSTPPRPRPPCRPPRPTGRERDAREIPAIADEVVAARLAGLVPPSEGQAPSSRPPASVGDRARQRREHRELQARPRRARRASSRSACRPAPMASSSSRSATRADVDLKASHPRPAGLRRAGHRDSADGFDVTARDPEARD